MTKAKLQSRKFWILLMTTVALFFFLWYEKIDDATFGLLLGFMINGYWIVNVAQKHVESRQLDFNRVIEDVVADEPEK